jgi:hypothetical protein
MNVTKLELLAAIERAAAGFATIANDADVALSVRQWAMAHCTSCKLSCRWSKIARTVRGVEESENNKRRVKMTKLILLAAALASISTAVQAADVETGTEAVNGVAILRVGSENCHVKLPPEIVAANIRISTATTSLKDLFASWKSWCEANGEYPGTARDLANLLEELGFARTRKHGGTRAHSGLCLVTAWRPATPLVTLVTVLLVYTVMRARVMSRAYTG